MEGWHKVVFLPPARADWDRGLREKVHILSPDRAMIVSREDTSPVVHRLTALGGTVREISRPSLEEVFLQMA